MIIQNNSTYTVGSFTGSYNKLPIGTYRLRQDERTHDFFLVKVENFKIPNKLYGDLSHIDRFLNTFKHQNKNLAVLLSGEKGSGKTNDSKLLCIKSGMPVIIIDEVFTDSNLINFLSSPELGSCVIFIDEYEKLYTAQDEELLILQILDGACNSKHLYLLTANSTSNINTNLLNRPSRIFYRKNYNGLDDSIIEDVISNELIHSQWKDELYEVLNKFTIVTFDILMSLVSEVNRYNESPISCAKLMNFVPQPIYVNITQVFTNGSYKEIGFYNLDLDRTTIDIKTYDNAESDSDYHWFDYYVKDIIKISKNEWKINIKNGEYFTLKLQEMSNLLF